MHFRVKTFIAAVGILLGALILNSVLSISFFENIYSRSLTSILESAGKNLQQKIERGIRLGKPLESYEGMSEALEVFLKDNPGTASVAVSNSQGDVLYLADAEASNRDLLYFHARKNIDRTEVVTGLLGNNYLIYVPLAHRDTNPVGAVLIVVSRQEVLDKISEMTIGTLIRLGWTLAPTVLVLVLILGIFVVRPIKKDLERIRRGLAPYMGHQRDALEPIGGEPGEKVPGAAGGLSVEIQTPGHQHIYDFRQVRNEIRQLGVFLQAIVHEIHSDIRCFRGIEDTFPELETIKAKLQEFNIRLSTFSKDSYVVAAFQEDLNLLLQKNEQILSLVDTLFHGQQSQFLASGQSEKSSSGSGEAMESRR